MSGAGDINTPSDQSMSPSLSIGAGGGGSSRYPNSFFDLSQQYMPPTIKELFRWCTFYFYNSPLIGSAIKKVSRYPITDMIFEDEHDSVKDMWQKIFNDILRIKDRLMEVNLDYHVYGNAFVSIHLPFTRFLICGGCNHRAPIGQWDWSYRGSSFSFMGKCSRCAKHGDVTVKDVPYKDLGGIRIIRWNPENIQLKFNEYTGRYTYMYTVPAKLKNAIMRGDKDILEDIPLIVLEAVKKRRMIRFSPDSLKHLKNPTLAEQDQGWGKPTIIHVLKDMYYFYTLRRAQEAIALEHIVPFDIIHPMPNAQQDPYVHTDLASWRRQIEQMINRHRRDVNFKAVIPIPVGFGRLGGDGKALLLGPELSYVTQTVVGGMGIPQEFLFGGLNFTGSSISLRTLENDFIQNRSQLLDLCNWISHKIRIWAGIPRLKTMRFADFRMADDVQRNQQLIGLNAQGKVSDQTLLTELGYDYDHEIKKRIEEIYVTNYLTDLQSKGSAKSQGEASIIQQNYSAKVQELAAAAQKEMQEKLQKAQAEGAPINQSGLGQDTPNMATPDQTEQMQPSGGMGQMSEFQQGGERQGASGGGDGQPAAPAGVPGQQSDLRVQTWARKLSQMQPNEAQQTLAEIRLKLPDVAQAIETQYKMILTGASGPSLEVNMDPLPQQRAPRRAGFA